MSRFPSDLCIASLACCGRATLFGAFGGSKRWLATNADGTMRPLSTLDFYKAGAMTGAIAAFTEGPIDFYKSQIQYQIIKSKTDPAYKRECLVHLHRTV